MLKNKILIKITGSIAAYKAASLISKLVQYGYEVKTVVTKSALNFIGSATLEGLTNNHVYMDTFENGQMMSHINLTKWADLTILAPADANTINKFSAGIADNLVTSLFLAHDHNKPYLIAPAMNTWMYNHPATKDSLAKLESWGIKIMPTETGYLACGDIGEGKLLDPDKIYEHIKSSLEELPNGRRILITSGGTKEKIDNVRFISNLSTGNTGATLADYFSNHGYNVTFLKSSDSKFPMSKTNLIEFTDFKSIHGILENELQKNSYDIVIHLAAISDYSPTIISVGDTEELLPAKLKLSSDNDTVKITLSRNEKIINKLKTWSKNNNLKLVGFKFVNSANQDDKKMTIDKLFSSSNADLIVYNTNEDRENNNQKLFEVI
ncbi:MAG: bifunctional phosphopantothenoylcysteine decarboxylase/phosphopantothenate--cysteine ligase CoaBC, partial [Melioribacteraceae bacterium]|nr:bifunctional phosphopantothenoylcysteine decarboxylase/phosphopantothenate--cysteine ligase CoaBC [Melioribacteraceae bacterium]